MDATKLLKSQHSEVKALFKKYESAKTSNQKQTLFEQIADALAGHCTIEEKIFYPSVYVGPLAEALEEAVEEHLAAKRVIADLLAMKAGDDQFDAKMTVLKEEIEHHVEEEEGSLFPKVERTFPRRSSQRWGTR
ncbi:MAG TPA: hemerythrin domain-containing protein [Myxococcaceae bacterium]|nr:hemerythrin domain-containing protein [Myxococcaceae bacterium]